MLTDGDWILYRRTLASLFLSWFISLAVTIPLSAAALSSSKQGKIVNAASLIVQSGINLLASCLAAKSNYAAAATVKAKIDEIVDPIKKEITTKIDDVLTIRGVNGDTTNTVSPNSGTGTQYTFSGVFKYLRSCGRRSS